MSEKNSFFTKKRGQASVDWDDDIAAWDKEDESSDEEKGKGGKVNKVGKTVEIGFYNVGKGADDAYKKIKKNTKNLQELNAKGLADKLMPDKLIRWVIGIMVALYSFVGVVSILILILYCLDYWVSTFYKTYNSYDWLFLYIICGQNSIGAIFGMLGTFKFGEIDEQIQILEKQNQKISTNVTGLDNNTVKLKEARTMFQEQVSTITDTKSDLESQIKAFHRLELELKSSTNTDNREIKEFLREVQALFKEFKILQTQVEKANLVQLFYELQFRDDDVHGLNENEYGMFLARLDEETRNKFKMKTFKQMDRNNDKTIDIKEFEQELNRIYDKMDHSAFSTLHRKTSLRKKQKKRVQNTTANDWKKWL